MMPHYQIERTQITATARKLVGKWTVSTESMFMSNLIKHGPSRKKGFKHQITVGTQLNWPNLVKWMGTAYGQGGGKQSWTCDWAQLFNYGRAMIEVKYNQKHTFNVYVRTDEQLSHFLLTWGGQTG